MKYFIFTVAALGVPPLAVLLSLNKRWMRYAFWGIVVAMCLYIPTSINFFSHEHYRGSSRGMEVSFIHLMSFAVIGALLLGRRFKRWLPDGGYWLYVIYFLLCLPSLGTAESGLYAWFEIWKMIMLFFFYVAVYNYLKATDDLKTVVGGLAAFAIVNMALVVRDHLAGVYQPHGVFPHQNGLAVAMHLFGTLFFASYVMHGFKTRFTRLCALAFACAAGATLRSYSRLAIALMPVGYGLTLLGCLIWGKPKRLVGRLAPIALAGLVVLAAILPRIIERFKTAPESSGDTRIELAKCAFEMIRDEPWRGVGINNWGIKINPPYDYAERAGRNTNRGEDFEDGIVETVYLLVGAECGLPALAAMLLWFGWYVVACIRLMRRLRSSRWFFIPAGLLGGMAAAFAQSCFEWVFRQQLNLISLMFMFATLSYLNANWRKLKAEAALEAEQEEKHARKRRRLALSVLDPRSPSLSPPVSEAKTPGV